MRLFSLAHISRAIRSQAHQLARIARMMVGVPDYGQYLEHMRRTHPELEPMSYEAFFVNRQQARYGRGRSGCC
ncbi:MAG: YbdD/YjiX family protein [Proteobacteria bacterium]|nr:YbdD/YjiX family protein [Pseudomonadota bacterium]HQR04099.1 YbdD/YjiX family protein [Rhodocyclaceae bacterium]